MLIALFGPDGSGKTSIAHTLAKDHKVESIRGTHTLASLMAQFFAQFTTFRGNDNPYYEISIPEKMLRLWYIIEFISVVPHVLYKFVFLPKFGKVVAERSIPDFVAWVIVTTKNPSFIRSYLGKFLCTLSKKQNRSIYITSSLTELCGRRPESTKLIKSQLPVYDFLAKLLEAFVVDTTCRTIEESTEEILKVMEHERQSKILSNGP